MIEIGRFAAAFYFTSFLRFSGMPFFEILYKRDFYIHVKVFAVKLVLVSSWNLHEHCLLPFRNNICAQDAPL